MGQIPQERAVSPRNGQYPPGMGQIQTKKERYKQKDLGANGERGVLVWVWVLVLVWFSFFQFLGSGIWLTGYKGFYRFWLKNACEDSCNHVDLYTIRTGSMRRIQWCIERCDSTKTRGATPKDANGGGKARLGAGFSILELSQRALYHWNRLDETNPMVSRTLR